MKDININMLMLFNIFFIFTTSTLMKISVNE